MPFKKLPSGKYKSPSGKIWTKKQVIAYHASGGTFSGAKDSARLSRARSFAKKHIVPHS